MALLLVGGATATAQAQGTDEASPPPQRAEASTEDEATTEEQENETVMDLITVSAEVGYRGEKTTSATRLNVALEELPLNIQVIPEDFVEDFQLLSQRDALQFHAAVDDKRIRGFNTSEFFRNGFVHLSDLPGYTIDKIEIVRGPTAVLNGPVTPGGAVNLITKQAAIGDGFVHLNTYWGVSGDDRDNRGLNIDLNLGSLGPERDYGPLAAFRLVAGFQDDSGFGTRVDNESYSILPSLRLHLGPRTFANLELYQYEINSDRTDRPMGIELTIPGPTPGERIPLALAYGVDPRQSWFGDTTDIEESVNDYSLAFTHLFSDQVVIDLEYNRHDRDFVFGPGNRPRIDIFYPVVLEAGAPVGSTDPDDFVIRRLTENLSLTNDIDQVSGILTLLPGTAGSIDHQIVIGGDFYDQDQHLTIQRPRLQGQTSGFFFEFFDPATVASDDLRFNAAGNPIDFVTVVDRLRGIEQQNLFVNYHGTLLGGRLTVLLGAYYSDIAITQTNLRAATRSTETIADNDELLAQAGLVFHASDTFSLYANYSESQLPDLNDPDFERAPPVRLGEQMEVGVKVDLGRAFNASLGYFMVDEELFGETFRQAEATGFEIDAFYNPSANWSWVFSYAHADTEVTASSDPGQVGDPLVDEVPNKAALWSRYDFAGKPFAVGGSLIWTGERVRPTAAAAQSVLKLDGRVLRYDPETRLDLFASYRLPSDQNFYEITLNLRNLTEEANISNTVPRVPLQGGIRPNGDPYVFDGEREVMVGLTVRY